MPIIDLNADQPVAEAPRDRWQAMSRGFRERCPSCGVGAIFGRYLKVNPACPSCGAELHHHRADDAPPYFTITIVGHVILAAMLTVEQAYAPALWLHMVMWLPLTLVLTFLLLPRIKGTLIGLQWALRMHGFSGEEDAPEALPSV